MKTFLEEVLTREQIGCLQVIINETPDSVDRVAKFKQYLGKFKDELLDKGLNHEYLAYVVETLLTGTTQHYHFGKEGFFSGPQNPADN